MKTTLPEPVPAVKKKATRYLFRMTPERVVEILKGYLASAVDRPAAEMSEASKKRRVDDVPRAEAIAHLKWAAERAIEFAGDPEQVDKAHRWLGFLQGVFWASGEFSIDELRRGVPEPGGD